MPGIHPSGDLIFMNYNTETIELKRVINTWDTELRDQWYNKHPNAK